MNVADKILKEMHTPEGQEKMKKWAEEYIEKDKRTIIPKESYTIIH